jgi:hypothetical protein
MPNVPGREEHWTFMKSAGFLRLIQLEDLLAYWLPHGGIRLENCFQPSVQASAIAVRQPQSIGVIQ